VVSAEWGPEWELSVRIDVDVAAVVAIFDALDQAGDLVYPGTWMQAPAC
jgi:hypothetical protein